jgi:hypothetical protein
MEEAPQVDKESPALMLHVETGVETAAAADSITAAEKVYVHQASFQRKSRTMIFS